MCPAAAKHHGLGTSAVVAAVFRHDITSHSPLRTIPERRVLSFSPNKNFPEVMSMNLGSVRDVFEKKKFNFHVRQAFSTCLT